MKESSKTGHAKTVTFLTSKNCENIHCRHVYDFMILLLTFTNHTNSSKTGKVNKYTEHLKNAVGLAKYAIFAVTISRRKCGQEKDKE